MSLHSFLVFVHVLGAVGLFAAMAIEAAAVRSLRRAVTPAEARVSLGVLELPARIGGPAMLATLGSGIWLMADVWGRQPWITATFAAIGAAVALAGRRLQRLRSALAAEAGATLSPAFRARRDAIPASLRVRLALLVAIVGLMTVKPGAAGSWSMLAAAAAVGLGAAVARRPSAPARPASDATGT